MKRFVLEQMIKWKDKAGRKPLILEGARQAGKTWLMREFGNLYFDDVAEFNFDEKKELRDLFETTKTPQILIEKLSIIHGRLIVPQKTLIIFDEIQECTAALNSLKYFKEKAPEYAVVSAGSLLGVYLAKGQSYPVGQVDIITVNPLSFAEFLLGCDQNLYEYYAKIKKDDIVDSFFHTRLTDIYHNYLIVGGLPECVAVWIDTKNPAEVLQKQKELQLIYELDFSKHNGRVNPAKILMVFRNIASQLAKENKKFIYSDIAQGARARGFEEAVEWLVTAGMLNRLYLTKTNKIGMKSTLDLSAFKLYLFDTGLLKYMAEIPNGQIILNKDFAFKGALAENFVLQELKMVLPYEPKYFTFDRYEADFIFQDNEGDIIPIEVKASTNVSSASFNAYDKRFSPKKRVRYSLLNYKRDGNIINIPFYLIGKTMGLV